LEPEHRQLAFQPVEVEWDLLNWSYFRTWQVRLPAAPAGTIVRYQIEAYPAGGGDAHKIGTGEVFSYLVGEPGPPAWAREAIIYQIFPDRFHPGRGQPWRAAESAGDIHGGTLRGIIDHLDYVADLGANCIWLNPFFPDNSHHGYHATDYFAVNPRLGTLDDIYELVEKAHQRGLRLVLDFVANHWGRQHPTFQAALADRHSVYHDWYHWDEWPDRYRTFFGVRELPQINLDNPAARAHMLRAAAHWVGDVGFDGYRLDYALGPSHDFWTAFRATVKAARPDAWLFGEVVETPPVQLTYAGRLDGTLDFLLMQALRDTFAFQTMSVAGLSNFLDLHEAFFPDYFSRPSFLDNHDVNRFLWLVQGDTRRLKVAALCQFTLPGPPIIYYGTEVGISQERDIAQPNGHFMEEARAPMLWGEAQDRDLLRFYRWLVRFRRRHPVLWRGQRRTVHLDETAGTWAYTLSDENETVVVALNSGEEACSITAAGKDFSLSPWSGDVQLV
jgi:glycosidase